MNGQIVLCKGENDGEELERTIRDLEAYIPHMKSLSVVPVGLTKFRDGLYPLEPFNKEDAEKTIDIIERWQEKIYQTHGIHFVQASDEFYILAERELPEESRYDGYIQLENGVGMIRLLLEECKCALDQYESDDRVVSVSVATGKLAAPYIEQIAGWVMEKFPNVTIHVYTIINYFFGEKITVSGLITGQDLIGQLKEVPLGERLLIPINMLRSGEHVFLDDITTDEVESTLQVPLNIVKSSGQYLIDALLGIEDAKEDTNYTAYELKEI